MDTIRPTGLEPTVEELEVLLEDEELRVVEDPEAPDDVKDDILQAVERRRETEIEKEQADGSTA